MIFCNHAGPGLGRRSDVVIIPLKKAKGQGSIRALSFRSYKQSFPANQVSIPANINSVNVGSLMRDIYYKPRNRTEVKSLLKNILRLLFIVLEKIAG